MGITRVGISGYGNLGSAIEREVVKNPDIELQVIFTRRNPLEVGLETNATVAHIDTAGEWVGKIDVMILSGGSATDFPAMGLDSVKNFNTVDSFDNHDKIPGYFDLMDAAAKSSGNISIISAGWDPGLFSLMRMYMNAILPDGHSYTFFGPGVSQGHSDAIRRIDGVVNAIQYTIPINSAVESVRRGENPQLGPGQKNARECYVVVDEDADKKRIVAEIKAMPYYFAGYEVTVHFITQKELALKHGRLTHGGNLIHTGSTGEVNNQMIELSLKLDSNPEFTASVMLAFARAAHRLAARGESGARTVLDIPPALLSADDYKNLIKKMV